MAATYAFRASGVGAFQPVTPPGAYYDAIVQITGDASYPAGGYAFGVAQLQSLSGGAYSAIESIEVANAWLSSTPSSFKAVYNPATGKVLAMAQAVAGAASADVDVTAGTNLSTFTCSLRVRFY